MQIQVENYLIKPMHEIKANLWLKFHQENRYYIDHFSTTKLSDYYTLEVQQKFIIQSVIDFERDEGYAFGVLSANGKHILAKVKSIRDPNRNHNYLNLRIVVDHRHRTSEFGRSILRTLVDYFFHDRKIHILYMPVLPNDSYMIQLVSEYGFIFEGRLHKIMHINGSWQDHLLYALINEDNGQ